MTTTNTWVPLGEVSPRQREAIEKSVLDPDVVNEVSIRRCEEICSELMEGLDKLPSSVVAARHALVWKLREANRPPRPRSPFYEAK